MLADKSKLYEHVKFLTTLRPFRNYRNIEVLGRVCDYLKSEFQSYGLTPIEQKFKAQGNEYKNIIASYQPEKRRRLIIGAHYDVCGDQPGADDNASAVAGLLESARMVARQQPNTDYRIDFVSFCLEEPPFFGEKEMGSYVHAKSVSSLKDDLIGLINFEMIGYFHDGPQLVPAYPEEMLGDLKELASLSANFIAVVGRPEDHTFNQTVFELMHANSEIDVRLIDHPIIENLAGLSDQLSYWKFEIPALMINDTSFLRNPNYHQASDDIETLDFVRMTQVVTSAYRAIVGM